ncbi:MAG: serine/threonine-protein kinase [Gemmatimonadales bacterium]|jgi:serine/threonine-protein kinase
MTDMSDTPAAAAASQRRTTAVLPGDLVEVASRRLGLMCLVWAGLWAFALVMNNLVSPLLSPGRPLDDAWPIPGNPVAGIVILVSLALFAYTRWHACDCRRTLDLGLLYLIVLAAAIAVVQQWTPNVSGLSWICVLVLIHPMIVPHTPARTLAAALVAASMDPLALWVSSLRGVDVPNASLVLWVYLPNYVCAFLSVLPAHVIRGLGGEVKQARELGSYQLGKLLGSGGMGDVYEATHRLLRRPAAVKLIRPDGLGARDGEPAETIVQRFKREAEAAASLHSPHTIALYDFGVADDGGFYYVMELLNGLDFDELVRRFGPVRPDRVVYLLRQACHSLAEAHAAGLIHRDIKPTNLFTCRVALEADFVKVLDFGLAKPSPGSGGSEVRLTAPEITLGTPAYMAPELARGEEVDHRIDIYAVGCVAYWLLTGRLVFEASTPMRMMMAHVNEMPEPPSRHSEIAVPDELEDLVLQCIEKDPDRRPADAEALSYALSSCHVGEEWTPEAAWRWWSTNLPELGVRPSTPSGMRRVSDLERA